jgi:hypothetical protein
MGIYNRIQMLYGEKFLAESQFIIKDHENIYKPVRLVNNKFWQARS